MPDVKKAMDNLLAKWDRGEAIVMAGVGSGFTARAAAKGGADLLATYNTAAYRVQALPTAMAFLPYDDCNSLSFSLVDQIMAVKGSTPLFIGLGAHDPRKPPAGLVARARDLGLDGVTNEPFIGMYEGDIRSQMEAAGLGFAKEVELIGAAAKAGMLAMGYVFDGEQAARMVDAGVHVIGAMVGGVTSGGSAGGAGTVSLDAAIATVTEIIAAVDKRRAGVPVLIHGGPLHDPASVQAVLDATAAAGYATGSTGERLPVEKGVKEAIESFRAVRARKRMNN